MDNKENMNNQTEQKQPDDIGGVRVEGHIKIWDPESNEIYVNKRNAIHYENMSEAIANSLGNKGTQFITEMHFGNGGTTVDPTGVITYLPTNTNTQNADLYNPTYYKIVDDTNSNNTDPLRNKIAISHVPGQVYSDIAVTCLLDYGEPSGQASFDNSQDLNGQFVFDELGLVGYAADGNGRLLTHVIFHPVQKSLNRLIQIDYTVRVQSLSGGNT